MENNTVSTVFNSLSTKRLTFPSLRDLDAMQRKLDHEGHSTRKRVRLETYNDVVKRTCIVLDRQFQENGIVHRLPRWKSFLSTDANASHDNSDAAGQSLQGQQHESTTEYRHQLINALQGHGRLFARCEFFYSDLDRGW
jgi:hypothetical protein